MAQRRVTVESKVGLHARPAAMFVEAASKAGGQVTVAKGEGTPVSAKSILAVMGLDVRNGDEIVIDVEGEGPDADALLDRLAEIANAD
ncbi:HPr family phosphocarrier protein [Streptomonospora nanhaiensis]|uniref:Phosphocarrier protein HPr n=1 Tax=Streptomonospora nanhaiensis TaxID=1323731 RepID=A0A853BNG7_9ACTN|nr:HPr family phosphocarrier protein [Streptomonospora nanhaiensis]MBV2362110.1 HPr family phosphocarrier protein [Streptomonospora nanhaiensis]MBV2364818.1 HPr family phosphocarrier protein [Streptomonospora nanhaiensis]MBX9388563.1 HPr family phosphocarrier protein [Streptomonospora nanhaiensis]NYI96061.1 phosphocarrier protein [Streptomonospora nanhaiensis]